MPLNITKNLARHALQRCVRSAPGKAKDILNNCYVTLDATRRSNGDSIVKFGLVDKLGADTIGVEAHGLRFCYPRIKAEFFEGASLDCDPFTGEVWLGTSPTERDN